MFNKNWILMFNKIKSCKTTSNLKIEKFLIRSKKKVSLIKSWNVMKWNHWKRQTVYESKKSHNVNLIKQTKKEIYLALWKLIIYEIRMRCLYPKERGVKEILDSFIHAADIITNTRYWIVIKTKRHGLVERIPPQRNMLHVLKDFMTPQH